MTVAQLRQITFLVDEAGLPEDRKIQLTNYVSGDYRLRFMDMNGNVLNFWINSYGESRYEAIDD